MTNPSKDQFNNFNADELREQFRNFTAPFGGDGSSPEVRSKILTLLKEFQKNGYELIKNRLLKDGKGSQCAKRLSHLRDETIRAIYEFSVNHVYRLGVPSTSERMSIIAVGGYGRGTLAPESDIDLLFLLPQKQTPWSESVAEYIIHLLWDIGLKVGNATRNVGDCIVYSKSDMTIRTAILEARFLCGDENLFAELVEKFRSEIVRGTEAEFIRAKLSERDTRHRTQGTSRYLVEPNVKDGKGGLRDLNTLFWICKYVYEIENFQELVKLGVFSQEELNLFLKCEDFLWAIRCKLHFLTSRAVERLTFDIQPKIASDLKYTPHGGLSGVERFMKHYFLIAKDVGDLTRILCATLEEQHIKQTPGLSRFVKPIQTQHKSTKIKGFPDFTIENQRIKITCQDTFIKDPVNLIRVFFLANSQNLIFHPDTMKQARRSLGLIDDSLRFDVSANNLFLEILTSKNDPETVLRTMNETGILGRFVPEFGKIVAMMQFNSYHHYTVDEHLLRSIGVLSEIERGELYDQHPLSTRLFGTIHNRRTLYVAMFLHDIAKGMKEDHSKAGAKVAEFLCPRFGMSPQETELVAWLVEHHLEMNQIAQTRDLHDERTIKNFAGIVQSLERLKLLIILTVADIKAVGPGVFTGWKGQLLRDLYNETELVLTGGRSQLTRYQRIESAKKKLSQQLVDWSQDECESYLERHYPEYWLREKLDDQIKHAELFRTSDKTGKKLLTLVDTHVFEANTRITVLAPDHPRLLTMIAGACVKAHANIVDSQICTTKDGLALDTIAISRRFDDDGDERRRANRIINSIENFITGQEKLPILTNINPASGKSFSSPTFSHKTNILVTNSWSDKFTVVEASGLDRPGLLFDLTNEISNLNLNISSAHITTFGERAVDVFYVTDLIGHKIESDARQNQIRERLTTAFEGSVGTQTDKNILNDQQKLRKVG